MIETIKNFLRLFFRVPANEFESRCIGCGARLRILCTRLNGGKLLLENAHEQCPNCSYKPVLMIPQRMDLEILWTDSVPLLLSIGGKK